MAICSFGDSSAMFDSTPIENMFILEYMPYAPDGFVRVYLYTRMLCAHPEVGCELKDIARGLRIEETVVINALDYWVQQGLMDRVADNPPSYKLRQIKDDARGGNDPMERDYYLYRDFNSRLQAIFGADKFLQAGQYQMANDWLNEMGFSQEMVIRLVEYEFARGRSKEPVQVFKRAEKKAIQWFDQGVHTLEEAETSLRFTDRIESVGIKILNQLGLPRKASINELELVDKWLNTMQMTEEEIIAACADTVKSRNPSFAYLDSILQSRHSDGNEYFAEVRELLRELGNPGAVPAPAQIQWYKDLLKTGYTEELIHYAARRNALKNRNSVIDLESLLKRLAEADVRTSEEADEYFARKKEEYDRIRKLFSAAGISVDKGRISAEDLDWYEKQREAFPDDMLELAARESKGTRNPYQFMNRILENWKKAEIHSVEEAETASEAWKAQNRSGSAGESKGKETPASDMNYLHHNYTENDFGKDSFFDFDAEYPDEDGGKQ